ncbi:hypothetical protein ABBQ38_015209 [Trebouxia sp. C0009 RCD-2024]
MQWQEAMSGSACYVVMRQTAARFYCIVLYIYCDHNIYDIRGRIELLRIAVLLYRILAIQQMQLPSDAVPLGSQRVFSSGATITVMEDYIIKHVDLQKPRHFVDQLSELQKMYKATAASKHLIRSKGGPYIRTKYTVSLYPFGEQLWPENLPARITSLA